MVRTFQLQKRACDGGLNTSCTEVAHLYETGQGVGRDPARALALYKQACKGGDQRACAKVRRMEQ
jgi:hypothetical protein